MVIDFPSEPAPKNRTATETVGIFDCSKMGESKVLEFPKTSTSSTPNTSGDPQRVGTYIIEKTIGKGNFSFVKLARHTVTNVKVLTFR